MFPRLCQTSGDDLQDRGRNAWTVLAAVSATNIITYGFSTSFGVFREHYFRTAPFTGIYEVAYAGMISLGLMQGLAPIIIFFLSKHPSHAKSLMWFGALLMVLSVIGAAFVSSVGLLILMLGIVQGIGGGCVFAPSLVYIDEWFVGRRTLANGLFFAMASLAPACLCPLFSYTLRTYSARTTLLGWSIACAVVLTISLPFIRPRRPALVRSRCTTANGPSRLATAKSSKSVTLTDFSILPPIREAKCDWGFDSTETLVEKPPATAVITVTRVASTESLVCPEMDLHPDPWTLPDLGLEPLTAPSLFTPISSKSTLRNRFYTLPIFYFLVLTTLLHNTVYFLPSLYMPSYSSSFLPVGTTSSSGSLLVTAFQLACIIAQPSYGEVVDRLGPIIPLLLATLGGSTAVLLVWGLAGANFAIMALFMVLFGATSGGFVVLRSSFATSIIALQKQKMGENRVWMPRTSWRSSLGPLIRSSCDKEKQSQRFWRASLARNAGGSTGDDTHAIMKEESLVSGLLMSIRGVATVVSGLVGKTIVQTSSQREGGSVALTSGYAGGERWRPLILFVGIMLAAASLGTFALARSRRGGGKDCVARLTSRC